MTIKATTFELDVGGEATIVQRGGEGPPLLFLHGEGDTSAWRSVHDHLAAHATVFAPILPGFGGTTLPDWLDGMDDLAFHLVDVIATLGLQHPLVVGESIGGWAALSLAMHRPDLLGGVVAIGALGLKSTDMVDLFIKPGPQVVRMLSHTLDADVVDPLTGDADAATALWCDQAAQARLMWKRPYDRTFERRVHHVTCPVAVVWGAEDRLLAVEHGQRLAELLGASFATVAGAGHLASVDRPEAVARHIEEMGTR